MSEEIAYFYINDLKIVAKIENRIPFIYEKGMGWLVDKNHIVMDRLIGYDGDCIGSTDMLLRIDEISEEDALKTIKASGDI